MNINDFDLKSISTHIEGTEDFISIDNDKCNLCNRCLVICIMNLWKKREGKIVLAEDYKQKCVECAACYQVCEPGAINFQYPAGGTGVVFEQG